MSVLTDTFSLANGTQIPQVGFGTWQIPGGETAYNAVADALEAGYRHIDTAKAYANESSVGKAIRDSGFPVKRSLSRQNCRQRSRPIRERSMPLTRV